MIQVELRRNLSVTSTANEFSFLEYEAGWEVVSSSDCVALFLKSHNASYKAKHAHK